MSIMLYKPRKMVCVIPGKEKNGFFAAKVSSGTVELNSLCKHVSDRCSMTGADVKGVIEALILEFKLELLSGKSISLGELGTFNASITSMVVEKKEDLKPRMVAVKTITYLPSPRLKKLMKEAKFMPLRDFNRKYNGIDEE